MRLTEQPISSVLFATLILLLTSACEPAAEQAQTDRAKAADDTGPIEWHAPLKIASGSAHIGPWRMNESDFHYVDDPTVAIGPQGSIAVAWADNEAQDVKLVRLDGDGDLPDEPVNVSSSPDTFSWLPRVAFGPDDETIHVLWQEILFTGGSHGGEILYARSDDGGQRFSEPINLSNTDEGAGKGQLNRQSWHNGSLDLLHGHDGNLYAAWTTYEGPLKISRSEDGGQSFSEPLHIAGDWDGPARAPSLALDPDGRILVAWTVGEDPRADIHLARQSEEGWSFDTPEAILPDDGHADAPKLGVDDSGHIHLVYNLASDGPMSFPQVVYSRAEAGTLDFSSARRIVPDDSDLAGGSGFADLAIAGSWIHIAWEHLPPSGDHARGLGFSSSEDGGANFSRPHMIPGSDRSEHGVSGGRQGLLMRKLDAGDDGRIAAVHSTFLDGEASAIWLFRGRAE